MHDMTDDQIGEELRRALTTEATSVRVTDAAQRVALARQHAERGRSRRSWALAGVAAAVVVALLAGLAFQAWHSQPQTAHPLTTRSASPSVATPAPSATIEGTPAPSLAAGRFVLTGSMAAPRSVGVTATLLADGRVLVVGGTWSGTPPVSTAELYDPKTGSFSPTGSMITARAEYTATLLPDGRVLFAGGTDPTGHGPFATAELYDPATGRFTRTGSLIHGRYGHTATLLADGRVLIAGGDNRTFKVFPAELYDPKTGKFSATGTPLEFRQHGQTATRLADGRVLIAGGFGISQFGISAAVQTAEIYDPASGKFSATGPMSVFRTDHTATLLKDGRVLIAGGPNGAEIYDPASGTFGPTGAMVEPRTNATATLLADGRVLIAGGTLSAGDVTPQASAEVFNPSTGTFSTTSSMSAAREAGTATLLADGRVLMAGGSIDATAELFEP